MAIDRLNPKLIQTTGASDGDALVYRSANGQIEFGAVASGGGASADPVQSNLHAFGSYANSTFATSTTVTSNKSISDTFGSYANSNFAVTTSNTSFSANVTASQKLVVTDRISVHTYTVTNSGSSYYVVDGNNNPDLYLIRGLAYRFNLNASGHPFEIRVSSGGSAYNTGVVGQQKQTGIIEFTVPDDAPDQLVYQCTNHSVMVGNIYIVNSKNISTNINTVQGNAASFASYANSTFATSATVTTNKSISDTFGTYANSTFATDTNLSTVQGNLTAFGAYANSTFSTGANPNLVQSNLHAFGSYANATFGSGGGAVKVENSAGVIDGAIANIVFGTGFSAVPTGTSNTVTVSVNSGLTLAYSAESQLFVADGTANTFTMTRSVSNTTNMFVSIDGLLQTPNDDYFVSGTTLTIGNTSPIAANTEIEARYIISSTSTANLVNDSFSANGSANTFTLSQTPSSAASLMITVGGILQTPSNNYIVSGTTLTLNNTSPIASNTSVQVRHLPATS